MAFLPLEQVRPGMVLESPVMGTQGRVLLRAGVALTRKHLDALPGLGRTRLDIRAPGAAEATTETSRPAPRPARQRSAPVTRLRPTPRTRRPRVADKPLDCTPDPVVPPRARQVMQTLEVKLPPSRSLRLRVAEDPVVAQKASAVTEAILHDLGREAPPPVREVLEKTAARTVSRHDEAPATDQASGSASEGLTIQNDALKAIIAEHLTNRPDH